MKRTCLRNDRLLWADRGQTREHQSIVALGDLHAWIAPYRASERERMKERGCLFLFDSWSVLSRKVRLSTSVD
jgi:hypothetical protein